MIGLALRNRPTRRNCWSNWSKRPRFRARRRTAAERLAAFFEANGPRGVDRRGRQRPRTRKRNSSCSLRTSTPFPARFPSKWKTARGLLHGSRKRGRQRTARRDGGRQRSKTGASFIGVVGEETNSRGARHLVSDVDDTRARHQRRTQRLGRHDARLSRLPGRNLLASGWSPCTPRVRNRTRSSTRRSG